MTNATRKRACPLLSQSSLTGQLQYIVCAQPWMTITHHILHAFPYTDKHCWTKGHTSGHSTFIFSTLKWFCWLIQSTCLWSYHFRTPFTLNLQLPPGTLNRWTFLLPQSSYVKQPLHLYLVLPSLYTILFYISSLLPSVDLPLPFKWIIPSHQILTMSNSHRFCFKSSHLIHNLSSSYPYLSFSFISYLYLLPLFLCLTVFKLEDCLKSPKATLYLNESISMAFDASYHLHHPEIFPSHVFC